MLIQAEARCLRPNCNTTLKGSITITREEYNPEQIYYYVVRDIDLSEDHELLVNQCAWHHYRENEDNSENLDMDAEETTQDEKVELDQNLRQHRMFELIGIGILGVSTVVNVLPITEVSQDFINRYSFDE